MDSNSPIPSTSFASLGSGIQAVGSLSQSNTPSFASDLPRSPKRRFNWRILAAIAAVAVLVIGGLAGFILTQQNQDLRQQASGAICTITRNDSGRNPCAGKSVGVQFVFNSARSRCVEPISEDGQIYCRIVDDEYFCAECNKWFPTSVGGTCSQRCAGSTGGPAGGGDNDTSPGAPSTAACGGSGQACCDPSSRPDGKICENNLFCTNGTCGTSTDNLCRGEDGSGQTGSFNNTCNLYICDKCSMYGGNAECRTFTASGNCAEMQARLDAANCGQVDFMQGNNVYCGVKSIKCGGSCAPTEPPTGPAPVQCREIAGRLGTLENITAVNIAPRIGENFFLKCRNVAGASSYRFRYYYTNKNDYATLAGSAVRVPALPNAKSVSQLIPIDRVGLYYGQCRVCMPDPSNPSGERCSAWESRTATKRLPFQEGGPFGNLQGDPTDRAVQQLAPSTVDADDGVQQGTIPALRSVFDYDIVTGGPEVSAGQPQTDTTQNTQTVDQPATQ